MWLSWSLLFGGGFCFPGLVGCNAHNEVGHGAHIHVYELRVTSLLVMVLKTIF